MSQMNPKEVFDNTAYLVQLPYIAGHSLFLTYKHNTSSNIGQHILENIISQPVQEIALEIQGDSLS